MSRALTACDHPRKSEERSEALAQSAARPRRAGARASAARVSQRAGANRDCATCSTRSRWSTVSRDGRRSRRRLTESSTARRRSCGSGRLVSGERVPRSPRPGRSGARHGAAHRRAHPDAPPGHRAPQPLHRHRVRRSRGGRACAGGAAAGRVREGRPERMGAAPVSLLHAAPARGGAATTRSPSRARCSTAARIPTCTSWPAAAATRRWSASIGEGEEDRPPHPQRDGAHAAAAGARRRAVRHPGALQHALSRRRALVPRADLRALDEVRPPG